MWQSINGLKKDVHDALLADDDETTVALLSNPLRTDLFYGFDSLSRSLVTSAVEAYLETRTSLERDISRLAEALGACRLTTPKLVRSPL